MIRGLMRSGFDRSSILLGQRGSRREAMEQAFGLDVAGDNSEPVERCDIVMLCVPPSQAIAAVRGLEWRDGQLVVSVCAGVRRGLIEAEVGAAEVVRAMPISAAALCASPTPIYPDEPRARAIFAHLGSVLPIETEQQFEVATIDAAVYGWVHDLIRLTADASVARGLDPATARLLAARTFAAAAGMVGDSRAPIADMVSALSTPGGITEAGLKVLAEHGHGSAWEAACEEVWRKLNRQPSGH
jgi:pyrroline-5-carboxylate reductase